MTRSSSASNRLRPSPDQARLRAEQHARNNQDFYSQRYASDNHLLTARPDY